MYKIVISLIVLLSVKVFGQVSHSKSLYIYKDSKASELKKNISKNDTIKEIIIYTSADSIFDCLKTQNFKYLKSISFYDIVLDKIPEFVFLNKELEYLYIENTNIIEVPEEIKNLESLNEVFIYKANSLVDLSNLFNLKKLKILRLPYVKFSAFPSVLNRFEELEELEISLDYPTKVTNQWLNKLCELKNLKKISIVGLKSFNATLDSIKPNFRIKELVFYNSNDIAVKRFLERQVFPTINSLTLSNCGLRKVPKQLKAYMSLELLDISNNNIRKIPVFILSNCKIKEIDATNTKIKITENKLCSKQKIILKSQKNYSSIDYAH